LSPKKLPTRPGDRGQARARRRIAEKYLEVAQLVATEDGAAINVCVGLSVLAGVAAGDAISIAAIGERYSGHDHAAAAELLGRVDAALGRRLRQLVDLKAGSHYGDALLAAEDRKSALRAASLLVRAAGERAP
jgi:hypothetical protein